MKKGLRILFVTPYVPSGVRVRPYAFIRELAARGHQVTLACLVEPAWEAPYLAQVSPFCEEVHSIFLGRAEPYLRSLASLPTATPLSVAYCRSAQFDRLVRDLIERGSYDLVHTEFVRAAPVTASLNSLPKVFDAVDSVALAYRRSLSAAHVSLKQRAISLVEWLKLSRYEPRLMDCYDRVVVTSPRDRAALSANGTKNGRAAEHVRVIPNGVDLDHFSFHTGPREAETIIFLGKMSYYVNVASVLWFYQQVLPLIRRQRPNVKFRIVGRNPVDRIKALAADPAVEVTGTVPDVRPFLAQATLAICPMVSGAGIQNKMLEAMAVGAPSVATSLACHALQAETGKDVLVADSAPDFAAAVLGLLNDEARRQQVAANGRRYVEQYHPWPAVGRQLEDLYFELIHNKSNDTGKHFEK